MSDFAVTLPPKWSAAYITCPSCFHAEHDDSCPATEDAMGSNGGCACPRRRVSR